MLGSINLMDPSRLKPEAIDLRIKPCVDSIKKCLAGDFEFGLVGAMGSSDVTRVMTHTKSSDVTTFAQSVRIGKRIISNTYGSFSYSKAY